MCLGVFMGSGSHTEGNMLRHEVPGGSQMWFTFCFVLTSNYTIDFLMGYNYWDYVCDLK